MRVITCPYNFFPVQKSRTKSKNARSVIIIHSSCFIVAIFPWLGHLRKGTAEHVASVLLGCPCPQTRPQVSTAFEFHATLLCWPTSPGYNRSCHKILDYSSSETLSSQKLVKSRCLHRYVLIGYFLTRFVIWQILAQHLFWSIPSNPPVRDWFVFVLRCLTPLICVAMICFEKRGTV